MNQRKVQLERRHFLQMVGASALTYPFLRGVPSYAAASGTTPTYLILAFTPCGCVRPYWGATGAGGVDIMPPAAGSAPTLTTNFTFRNTLMPFATGGTVGGTAWTTNLQSKVIVLDGLNNKAAQGSHEAGMASLWTGQISTGAAATSVSIDQQIAAQLAAGTPFPSIQLMIRSPADFTDREVKTRMLYNAAGVFIDPIDNPTDARQTLFGTVMGQSAGPDKTTFIRQQLFGGGAGQLNSELSALMPRVCNDDRAQLQALQDGWNNLDSQLKAAAMATANCTAPPAVTASTDFPTNAKLQMDILALALACDLTRVASLQFSTSTSQVTHTWLGTNQTDCHHNYSHNGPTYLGALAPCTMYNNMGTCATTPDIYSASNANLYQNLAQQKAIDNWYATQVAYFAQRLNGLTGANGSLLDQSVICWGNELDMGAAHNHDDTPFVLIGGANGKLKTGQLVTFPLDLTDGSETVAATKDRSHNDLLLTLAQVMGTPPSTGKFGEPTYCTGPITQILSS
jgi:Protein of unknown function (DUF1552)